MDIIALLFSLAVPVILGWQLLNLFFNVRRGFFILEKFFFALGLGFGSITLLMFIMSLLGVHFIVLSIVLFSLTLLIVFGKYRAWQLAGARAPWANIARPKVHILKNWVFIFICLFIGWNILTVFFRTMVIDVDMWDSWAFWAFKAKIFYCHKIVPLEMFQKFKSVWGNWDYPLHVPLMETWIYVWLDYWNDFWPRFLFPLFYTGLSFIIYWGLRHLAGRASALIGLTFLSLASNVPISKLSSMVLKTL